MAQPHTWLNEVIIVLKEFGGHATLEEIYEKVEERDIMDLSTAGDYRATIRGIIYRNTSDSPNAGEEIEKDIFFSVNGVGEGHWGLREEYNPTEENIDVTEDDAGFPEGKRKLKQHATRERNPALVQKAKEKFKQEHGDLFCEICGFNYEEKYGEVGKDYIEAHHTIPVSELDENHVSKIEDLVMVCADCHRMLHRRRPWLEKEELENLIQEQPANIN